MINVSEMIKKAMKKELFNTDEMNLAARQILSEMKTKFIDIKEEITNDIQYKMLIKMKKERESSVEIYKEAFEKNNSEVAKNNLIKSENELRVLNNFISELEAEMPKKLSEDEIKSIIVNIMNKVGEKVNIGMIMKEFKGRSDVDMSVVSKIAKSILP
jgi:uncharacterized protein YqeY